MSPTATRQRLAIRAGLVLALAVIVAGLGLGIGRPGGHRLILENRDEAAITEITLTIGGVEQTWPSLPPGASRTEPLAADSGEPLMIRYRSADGAIGRIRTNRPGPGTAGLVVTFDRDPETGLLQARAQPLPADDWTARLFGRR